MQQILCMFILTSRHHVEQAIAACGGTCIDVSPFGFAAVSASHAFALILS